MIIIADNDVVHKLTCCDLLNEFLVWLDSPPNQIYILPTLIYKVRRLLKNDEESLARLEQFVKNNTELTPSANVVNLERFESLDVGERMLLAVFVENSDKAKFLTGDKRAIKDIAKLASEDINLHACLTNKVECLEMIMLGLINKFSFEVVNEKVTKRKNIDGVLNLAFGRTEEHAISALNSFIDSIKAEATFIK